MYLHILQPKLCQKYSARTALKQKCNILFPSSIGMWIFSQMQKTKQRSYVCRDIYVMHLIFLFFYITGN